MTDDLLTTWIAGFVADRQALNLANATVLFYKQKLRLFMDYCQMHSIRSISQINAGFIRQYMYFLKERNHNAGGRHAAFRTLRAFLNWYGIEEEPDDWENHRCMSPPQAEQQHLPFFADPGLLPDRGAKELAAVGITHLQTHLPAGSGSLAGFVEALLGCGKPSVGDHVAQDRAADVVPGGGRQPGPLDPLLEDAVQRLGGQSPFQPAQIALM
jgi:hypothetical protein